MQHKYLISIIGPTAIGKTSKSIQLANYFSSEIISADSRQFFKEMKIGTAVPTTEELEAIPHHFIQHISIEENYSVGDFERDAIQKINNLFQQHDKLFLVGGSGLYLKAIHEGLNEFPEVDPKIRTALNEEFQQKGIFPLQEKLKKLDPEYAKKVDLENPHRVMRALEICLGSSHNYSYYLNKPPKKRDFKSIKIGLTAEREKIYERIELRVDLMMKDGLLEEAKKLYEYRNLNALNTVGYKELFSYLEGKYSLPEAISEIKKNTRRFAKRQLTWFRKDPEIKWFNYNSNVEEIINYIEQKTSSQ
ncbi:tRNA (adenosine(37)-N6)-dimethylallyltransferase MiaA [Mesonia maritima]|uniref:tRNA dimethylallyltransferase n=1 Tax=Mesonia maritima TaxID=1793873 RepID=A0ABU1K3Y5_9FLAO|nr:tRNA (adenosine(37)-N6)-dimethylallyltransferase MiaA [Mesonia maritima]MDR6300311.1 tRNA dimethylallyltransferase [Mesonia maritima]